jgi:hypothetical protein
MKLKEMKEWLQKLPTEMDEYEIVLGELGQIDSDYWYRQDAPIAAMDVDRESKEILIMRMSDKELTKEELDEMQNKAD